MYPERSICYTNKPSIPIRVFSLAAGREKLTVLILKRYVSPTSSSDNRIPRTSWLNIPIVDNLPMIVSVSRLGDACLAPLARGKYDLW